MSVGGGSERDTYAGFRAFAVGFVLAATVVACASIEWQPVGPRRTAAIVGAEPVGAEECSTCHEDVQGHRLIAGYHAGCESCHGGGSLHAESESPVDIRYPDDADCLVCHASGRGTHLQWGTGDHARGGVICSDCHNPHDTQVDHLRPRTEPGLPYMDSASAMCVGCHADIASRLRFPSHHPLAEGKMKCTSCHDPHEDSRARVASRTDACAGCHQDVVGPWVFEHEPVTEDCGFCHDAHGSVTSDLLSTVQPALCLSCHTFNDRTHHNTGTIDDPIPDAATPAFLRNCTNCHSAVHGSLTDEHLRH